MQLLSCQKNIRCLSSLTKFQVYSTELPKTKPVTKHQPPNKFNRVPICLKNKKECPNTATNVTVTWMIQSSPRGSKESPHKTRSHAYCRIHRRHSNQFKKNPNGAKELPNWQEKGRVRPKLCPPESSYKGSNFRVYGVHTFVSLSYWREIESRWCRP